MFPTILRKWFKPATGEVIVFTVGRQVKRRNATGPFVVISSDVSLEWVESWVRLMPGFRPVKHLGRYSHAA